MNLCDSGDVASGSLGPTHPVKATKPGPVSTEWTDIARTGTSKLSMPTPSVVKPKYFAVPLRGLELEHADEDNSGICDSDSDEEFNRSICRPDSFTRRLDDIINAYRHFKEAARNAYMPCVLDKCTQARWLDYFDAPAGSHTLKDGGKAFEMWLKSHQEFVERVLGETVLSSSPDTLHFIYSVSADKCICEGDSVPLTPSQTICV